MKVVRRVRSTRRPGQRAGVIAFSCRCVPPVAVAPADGQSHAWISLTACASPFHPRARISSCSAVALVTPSFHRWPR